MDLDGQINEAQAHRRAQAIMREIADGLTDQGMDILGQEWQEAHYLKASNVWGALCEAVIGANGVFTWEYRPVERGWDDPEQVAVMAARLLGADGDAGPVPSAARFPGQTLKGAAGMRARQFGLDVRLAQVFEDDRFLEFSGEVEVTNPARPERGRVMIRDNSVWWECQMAAPDGQQAAGLGSAEITEIVGGSVPQLTIINGPPGSR